jgi:hypothetical protein
LGPSLDSGSGPSNAGTGPIAGISPLPTG